MIPFCDQYWSVSGLHLRFYKPMRGQREMPGGSALRDFQVMFAVCGEIRGRLVMQAIHHINNIRSLYGLWLVTGRLLSGHYLVLI